MSDESNKDILYLFSEGENKPLAEVKSYDLQTDSAGSGDPVKDAFARGFIKRGEHSVAIVGDGRPSMHEAMLKLRELAATEGATIDIPDSRPDLPELLETDYDRIMEDPSIRAMANRYEPEYFMGAMEDALHQSVLKNNAHKTMEAGRNCINRKETYCNYKKQEISDGVCRKCRNKGKAGRR